MKSKQKLRSALICAAPLFSMIFLLLVMGKRILKDPIGLFLAIACAAGFIWNVVNLLLSRKRKAKSDKQEAANAVESPNDLPSDPPESAAK